MMKAVAMFVAFRVVDVTPEPEQTLEDALQCYQESILDDPFAFVDSEEIQVQSSVSLVKAFL